MIKETKNYAQFKYLQKNRPIEKSHVRNLISSINMKNLLDIYPIIVNRKMEVLDGQHRLEACKELGIPAKYRIEESLTEDDIIPMNVSKKWQASDYLRFYVEKGDEHYIRLEQFMKEAGINLRIALSILTNGNHEALKKFKSGEFIFNEAKDLEEFKIIQETCAIIQSYHGKQTFTGTGKFWKALLFLIKAPEFKKDHWLKNVDKMSSRFMHQITTREYLKSFIKIYNYFAAEKMSIERFIELDDKY